MLSVSPWRGTEKKKCPTKAAQAQKLVRRLNFGWSKLSEAQIHLLLLPRSFLGFTETRFNPYIGILFAIVKQRVFVRGWRFKQSQAQLEIILADIVALVGTAIAQPALAHDRSRGSDID